MVLDLILGSMLYAKTLQPNLMHTGFLTRDYHSTAEESCAIGLMVLDALINLKLNLLKKQFLIS